jgi:tripartite-type tricarboxylate transporter receptor subunit TctC
MKKGMILFLAMLSFMIVWAVPGSASELEAAKFERDILIIVPYNPGAVADAYAQMIKKVGEKYLGHNILLEYKPGGNTSVGTTYMLARAHDGYTASIPGNSAEYTVATGQAESYDESDFVSVGSPANEQSVLIVPVDSPFKTLDDVVEFARKNPGQLNWGASLILGFNHFFALQTMQNAGIEFNYVPYDNAGEAVIAIMGKNVDVATVTFSTALPYYKSQEVKVIAQSLEHRDMETLPEVPTIYETPGLEYEKYGIPFVAARPLIVPSDVPKPMLKAWDNFLQQVVADSEWLEWIKTRQVLSEYMNGEECTALIRNNVKNIRRVYEELILSKQK